MSAAAAGFLWTGDVAAKAQRLWREGLSAGAIAKRIGASRSAVCGYAARNRDRFPPRMNSIGKRTERTRKAVAKTTQMPAAKAEKPVVKKPVRPFVAPWLSPVAPADRPPQSTRDLSTFRIPDREPVAFADLGARQCRFPLEAFETVSGPATPCCGAVTADDKSYCTAHLKLMRGPK